MRLLYYILLLVLVSWLGIFLHQNPGSVEIVFNDWVVHMPLWVPVMGSVLALFILSLVMSFFSAISKAIRRMREWITGSTMRAVTNNANLGWIAFAEGDWSRAETFMLKAAKHSEDPVFYYLTAAEAAQEQSALDRRDSYLHLASKSNPDAKLAVGLFQAELQIKQGQYESSLAALQEMQRLGSHNCMLLKLLVDVYTYKQDWPELVKLLPQLKKYSILQPDHYMALEIKAYNYQLDLEAKKHGKQEFILYWDNTVSKTARQQPEVIAHYAKLLLTLGAVDEAEQVVRYALKRQWDNQLAKQYGLIMSSDPGKQIASAESWFRSHPNDADLLLTLGRLCIAHKLWGKARNYLDSSIAVKPNPDAYAELGRLLVFLGEQQKALDSYKNGLLVVANVLPIDSIQR